MKIRKRSMLIVPTAAALMLGAGIGPASAAVQNPHANCIGQVASTYNQYGREIGAPGRGGQLIALSAPVGHYASNNSC